MIRRLAIICLLLAGLAAACGIPDNGQVSRIQNADLGQLDDTIPTTTTTTPTTTVEPTTTTTLADSPTTTTIAIEDVTLYFISGGALVEFPRALPKGATPNQVLAALQDGPPSGELGAGLRTAVPKRALAQLTVAPDDASGVATVELPTGFYDTISQEDQRFAIGQIVLSIIKAGDFGQVRFTQNGQAIAVPRGSGDVSEPGQPLPSRDYQALLEPPVTTTTTTVTTTVTTTTTTVP